jgi:hypothetical protein
MIKTLLFLRKKIFVFFTVAVGEARKIKRELLELSGLLENRRKTQLGFFLRNWSDLHSTKTKKQ